MVELIKQWLDEGKISRAAYLNLIGEQPERNTSTSRELRISVLINTYKRANYLIRLLDSIRNQEYSNCEIIIVDDASNDETESIVSQYKENNHRINISYCVNADNLGVSETRRRAYLKASGDIIIFTDDDDYYIDPSYFSRLSQLYEKHADCTMTIAASIKYNQPEEKWEYLGLNTPDALSNQEYLNGFMWRYTKPSLFALSMKKAGLDAIHYEELQCFNDTSLNLFGLLGKGKVYTINQAIGVYYFHSGNISGNAKAEFITENLESKEDIFQRAKIAGLLDHPKEWYYRNMSVTATFYLAGNRRRTREDKLVWRWMSEHLDRIDYYRFIASVIKTRIMRKQGR